MDEFLKISYLLAPLLVGLAFHGLCIKFGWLRWLARPVDAGLVLRGRRLLGDNKTYRGVVAVALGTAAGVAFQAVLHRLGVARDLAVIDYGRPSVIALGLGLGAAAMFSELPNSMLKRQLGIAPGAAGSGLLTYVLLSVGPGRYVNRGMGRAQSGGGRYVDTGAVVGRVPLHCASAAHVCGL